jgi:hypothetical protein
VVAILLVNLAALRVYSTDTHVIVEKYEQDEKNILAKSGDDFKVKISLKNISGEYLEDFYFLLIAVGLFTLTRVHLRL